MPTLDQAKEAAKAEHSERLLARALHLLTLMLHTAMPLDSASADKPLADEVAQLPPDMRDAFGLALIKPHPSHEPIGSSIPDITDPDPSNAAPSSAESSPSAERRPSAMLQGLGGVSGGHHGKASVLELVRTLSKREGPMQRHCLWIVKELKRAWPKVREACNLIEAAEAEASGEGLKDASPQSAEASEKAARLERKKKAQQRAMAQLAKQKAKFMEQMEAAEAEERKSRTDERMSGGSALNEEICGVAEEADVMEEEEDESRPICIICHTADSQPLGFVCCAQPSTVLVDAPPPCLGVGNAAEARSRLMNSPDPGLYLNFCGHAVHTECLSQYKLSLEERARSSEHFEGRSAINVRELGEFLCPLCKRLSNALVPYMKEARSAYRASRGKRLLQLPRTLKPWVAARSIDGRLGSIKSRSTYLRRRAICSEERVWGRPLCI